MNITDRVKLINEFLTTTTEEYINVHSGKIERNKAIKDYEKFLYKKGVNHNFNKEEFIFWLKTWYYEFNEPKVSMEEFYDNLKLKKFKYNW